MSEGFKKKDSDEGGEKSKPTFGKGRGFMKKKVCRFCADKINVDYKDVFRNASFITEAGKIVPARISGTCARHQRALTRAIKVDRALALLPPPYGMDIVF